MSQDLVARVYCPFCSTHTSLEPALMRIGRDDRRFRAWWPAEGSYGVWWIGLCTSCRRAMLVRDQGSTVYPEPLPSPTDHRIPDKMHEALVEAKKCLSVGALHASATMSRRAIEAACNDKGATAPHLWQKVKELTDKHIITQDLKEWADVVRWVGNDGAHPLEDPVSRQDANAILQLAEQFLHVIYVAPAIAQAQRAKMGR